MWARIYLSDLPVTFKYDFYDHELLQVSKIKSKYCTFKNWNIFQCFYKELSSNKLYIARKYPRPCRLLIINKSNSLVPKWRFRIFLFTYLYSIPAKMFLKIPKEIWRRDNYIVFKALLTFETQKQKNSHWANWQIQRLY